MDVKELCIGEQSHIQVLHRNQEIHSNQTTVEGVTIFNNGPRNNAHKDTNKNFVVDSIWVTVHSV